MDRRNIKLIIGCLPLTFTNRKAFLLGAVGTVVLMLAGAARAQTTAFTYQGKLTDNGNPANGSYDLQFALFDAGGTQIGSTLTRSSINVSTGIFTVQLDFGVNAFPGANRFLEIAVRSAGGGSFTILSPRQQISSTPYAIHTLSATSADSLSSACAGCVQDSQINSVAGSKVNGTIPVASVPAGSANYIQNTSNPQSNANFNISGNGFIGGNVGIGTNSPVTKLEVVHPVTQIRFGPSTADNGGYLISTHGSQAIIAGGARWNSGQWIARAGSASLIALGSGVIQFTTNGGLTEDTAFTPTERMRVDVSGFVGIGTDQPTARLHVRQLVFDTALRIETGGTNDFISGVVGDSQKFHIDKNGAYVTGSDFAEALPYTGNKADYEPGDVLVLSAASAGAIEKSDRAYDVHVTGIYSTRPGVLGAEKGGNSRVDPNDLPVAILGIVPAKVSAENGPIRIGDLLTTSTTPGHAMRCDEPLKCIGAIVGKALEPMEKGKGIIKVLVMLR